MPIDQARLTAFWAEYIKQLPETDAQTRSQMEAEPIANGNEVRVMVQTQMQAHDLQTNAALIGYLKQNLGNAMLTIKAEVDPAMAKNVRVVYTVEQKLEYFSEKNEVFQEFIKKFNLEAEF